jgi:hypothetical protein
MTRRAFRTTLLLALIAALAPPVMTAASRATLGYRARQARTERARMLATPAVEMRAVGAVAGSDTHASSEKYAAALPPAVVLPSAWIPPATVTVPGVAPIVRSNAHWTTGRPPPRLLG